MRILFVGHKDRGLSCFNALISQGRHKVVGVVTPPLKQESTSSLSLLANQFGLPVLQPEDINTPSVLSVIREINPEMIVLAGYGQILRSDILALAPRGAINLHAGKLPKYRGSSPLNWALINGETEFTLTIIQVDKGIDTGDILSEKTFPISIDDTIDDLHNIVNREFPRMLLEVIDRASHSPLQGKKQDENIASYYPLRFPDDSLVFFDLLTANQLHNRIRALTAPYPAAFTYFKGRQVRMLRSKLAQRSYFGEPGRIYLKNEYGLLVCASDQCLWISQVEFQDDKTSVFDAVCRYDKFATLKDFAGAVLSRASS